MPKNITEEDFNNLFSSVSAKEITTMTKALTKDDFTKLSEHTDEIANMLTVIGNIKGKLIKKLFNKEEN